MRSCFRSALERLEHRQLLTGELDFSFSADGVDRFRVSTNWSVAVGALAAADGKVIVASVDRTSAAGDAALALSLRRYTADGTMDAAYASSVRYTISGAESYGFRGRIDMVPTADGGFVTGFGKTVLKFTSAGALDATFNGTGARKIQWAAVELAMQGTKVLVSDDAGIITRLLASGATDMTFGNATTSGGGFCVLTGAIAIQGFSTYFAGDIAVDGSRILVAGTTSNPLTSPRTEGRPFISAILPNGNFRDNAFGTSGTRLLGPDAGLFAVRKLIVEPGSKYAVALTLDYEDYDVRELWMYRTTSAGALDAGFINGGTAYESVGTLATADYADIARQADGKYVVFGHSVSNAHEMLGEATTSDLAVMRLSSLGVTDPSFHYMGTSLVDAADPASATPGNESAAAGVIDSAGRYVIVGQTGLPGTLRTAAVVARVVATGGYTPVTWSGNTLILTGTNGADRIACIGYAPKTRRLIVNDVVIDVAMAGMGSYGLMKIDALAGNDRIDLGKLSDAVTTIYGGLGNDYIVGGWRADDIWGGGDTDTVSYAARTVALSLKLDGLANDGVPAEGDNLRDNVEVVQGGSAGDVIDGNVQANTLIGNGGNDTIQGLNGNDSLVGSSGNDRLFGGAAAVYAGEWGGDTLDGGTGNDYLDGGTHDDRLFGYDGNDTLIGGKGRDSLDGGTGDDRLYNLRPGSSPTRDNEVDTLLGGTGTDTSTGADAFDILNSVEVKN